MLKNPLLPFLHKQAFVVLDGALATELERRGADIDDPVWSAQLLIKAPEMIRQLHYDYFLAGADVAVTASYQATFEGFGRRGLNRKQATGLLQLSVDLALEARELFWGKPANRAGRIRPLVAASIGPYGAFLADGSEYSGDYGLSVEELMDFHLPRMEILATSGADLLACETIPCLVEAEAIIRLLEGFPGMPAWLSFSCCDEKHNCHGELFEECVTLTGQSEQLVATGINCTPPQFVESLVREAASVSGKTLLAYPNSGEKWDAANHCWLEAGDSAGFGKWVQKWYAAGARLIGGCCRTDPAEIKGIRAGLSSGG